MTKRRLVWVVVAVAVAASLALVAGVAFLSPTPAGRVTPGQVQWVGAGLTVAEVRATLGEPLAEIRSFRVESRGVDAWDVWDTGRGSEFHVGYDAQGQVREALLAPIPAPTWMDRLRAWLGW